MSDFILDASAILAAIFHEPGERMVESVLDRSAVSRINVTEVLTKLIERGSSIDDAIETVDGLNISVIEFDENQSRENASLRSVTRHLGLSLGDRACIALAIRENAVAVTADRHWKDLTVCSIQLIR
ncbi:MAG: type II toxin-antitoxin system VapC family toxin [Pyrinomonadaceae bacterium]